MTTVNKNKVIVGIYICTVLCAFFVGRASMETPSKTTHIHRVAAGDSILILNYFDEVIRRGVIKVESEWTK